MHDKWKTIENKKLHRQFDFEGFEQAMDFVNAVAKIAQKQDHHPDITINYNKVTLELSTHSAGGLTDKDTQLAEAIDQI